jgi:hypothetical protein
MDAFGPKQPYDEYYVDFDFSKDLVSPDAVSVASVTATDENGADATLVITSAIKQSITSPKVFVWVKGGVDRTMYVITCKIVTTNGEKYEKDGEIFVEEVNRLTNR